MASTALPGAMRAHVRGQPMMEQGWSASGVFTPARLSMLVLTFRLHLKCMSWLPCGGLRDGGCAPMMACSQARGHSVATVSRILVYWVITSEFRRIGI